MLLQVSSNGYLAFSPDAKPFQHPRNGTWPNKGFPSKPDPPLIAPYYAQVQLTPSTPHGSRNVGEVLWKIVSDSAELERFTETVRTSMVDADNFEATHAFLATWINVTCNGCFNENLEQYPRNTFQVAVVTDEIRTYALVTYTRLTWTGGSQTGGDAATGTGARYPPAQAFFNAGNATYGFHLPSSGTKDDQILRLPQLGGSDVDGRYVYEISDDVIKPGGCLKTSSNVIRLVLSPSFGDMFGGNVVEFTGPCFSPSDHITCTFNDVEVSATYINRLRAQCVVPNLTVRGQVQLTVSLNSGHKYSTTYTIANPGTLPRGVQLLNATAWGVYNPERLELTWDTTLLDPARDPSAKVNVELHGYREQTAKATWKVLKVLAKNIANTGHLSFSPQWHRCGIGESDCLDYEMGAVTVTRVEHEGEESRNPRRIWSKLISLGWYFYNAALNTYGNSWSRQKCVEWYKADRKNEAWQSELPACPCTLDQALADFGRWQADVACDMNTGSVCAFHVGAIHCVRSVQATSAGAGNQCCYRKDGMLMTTVDTFNGSTPDRSHAWGDRPYGTPPKVPALSHWIHDVVPFFYCCLWTGDSCHYYMEQRPTSDCKNYKPPKPAVVYGDPHLITLDGRLYTFNGKGEYLLLRDTQHNFQLQGRFGQTLPDVKATVIKSIAMREGALSDIIEVRINPPGSNWKRDLTILVNHEVKHFERKGERTQDFKGGVTVINNDPRRSSNITVYFECGIGVQATALEGLLNVVVMAPPSVKFQTQGLFGSWDDDASNDINGTSAVQIHNSSEQWRISEKSSLFTYGPRSYAFYQDLAFQPAAINFTAIPSRRPEVATLCGSNQQCAYDYVVTGDEAIARGTLAAARQYEILKERTKPVQACGILDIENSIKLVDNYLLGGRVTVTGCQPGYELSGNNVSFTCSLNGTGAAAWSPLPTLTCVIEQEVSNEAQIQYARTTATVLAVLLPTFFVFLVLGAGLTWWIHSRSRGVTKSRTPEDELAGGRQEGDGGEGHGMTAYHKENLYTLAEEDESYVFVNQAEIETLEKSNPNLNKSKESIGKSTHV
ncbi:sushi domain-containing protein 2-like [Lingula anatina]|uniref:Sushi domain-containing protein 2-like n=1 Tax=Lingula anatina TaxID=7574 RepID=A0A1S3K7H8_LINAN|nr:sushi domain-containing protein 2-like [Lingula anatina]|eukprot:XP_013418585.1 sushi domain-containing protein 2-like [Lingula anatina]